MITRVLLDDVGIHCTLMGLRAVPERLECVRRPLDAPERPVDVPVVAIQSRDLLHVVVVELHLQQRGVQILPHALRVDALRDFARASRRNAERV